MIMADSIPDGLTALEYARGLLESIGWPNRGNLELMADCITAISISKKLNLVQAYKYLIRAIKLGKEQGQDITRMWFQGGEYMNIRPKKDKIPLYKGPTKEELAAFEAHRQTPEYKEAQAKWEAAWRKLAGDQKFQTKREKATDGETTNKVLP